MGTVATVTMVVTGRQVRKTLDAGLCPILCVGETREEYEAKLNKPVCALQLSKVAPFPSHALARSGASVARRRRQLASWRACTRAFAWRPLLSSNGLTAS